MRTKSKNLVQDYDSKLRIPSTLSLRFRFSFLAFCLLALGTTAEVSSEQLDPTHLLVAYLVETSQDLDRPNITATASKDMNTPSGAEETLQDVNAPNTLVQPSRTQPNRQEQSQTGSDPNEATAVSSTAQLDNKSPQSLFATAPIPNNHFGRKLWKTRMGVPKSEEDNRSRAELQRMIEQIRSIKFERINLTAEPVIAAELAPVTEPNETLSNVKKSSDITVPKEIVEEKQIKSENEKPLPYQPLTNQTLQMIRRLLRHAEQADNPLELAEVLFRSGHLKEASVFYQEALNCKNVPEPLSAQEKAWILFQIGNCLRNDDLPRATKMYRQLILECPDSPWTDLAKTQEKLINWHQKDEPRKLVGALAK